VGKKEKGTNSKGLVQNWRKFRKKKEEGKVSKNGGSERGFEPP